MLRGGSLVIVSFVIISGWFYLRNWRLYFDPSGWSVWLKFGEGAREELPWLKVLEEWGSFRDSYWALFGGVNIQVHEWIYSVLDLLVLVALVGLVIGLIEAWRGPAVGSSWGIKMRQMWALSWVPLLWLALIIGGLFIWTSLIEASQGRLIFPATGSVSLLLTYGLSRWVPRRWHGAMAVLLAMGFFIFALACPFIYIMPAYKSPSPIYADEVPDSIPQHDIIFGDDMRLVAGGVAPGPYYLRDRVPVSLCWQGLRKMERDWSVFIHAFGSKEKKLGQTDVYPTLGLRPTSYWDPGDVYCNTYDLPLKKVASVPVLAEVVVGLYDYDSADRERLPPLSSAGEPVGRVEVGRIKVIPRQWPIYEPDYPAEFRIGGVATLVGYDLDERVVAGEELDCTLYWRVEQPVLADYTVFNHLSGSDGKLWGQLDSQPARGDYPTSAWAVGEIVRDEHDIPVRRDAPPGQYQLEVGMYLLRTGERLPVMDKGGVIGSSVLLGSVEVVQ